MKKLIAIVFAVFGFASQAFACGETYQNCPEHGDQSRLERCELNPNTNHQHCLYTHQAANDQGYHSWWYECN